MTDNEPGLEIPDRLQILRSQNGLTIQQMADRCSIPKSSLESYMRATNAKRPGVVALVSIANGMGVSVDWLVGRSGNPRGESLKDGDYAVAAFNTVKAVLEGLQMQQREAALPVVNDELVGGLTPSEGAAQAMAHFMEFVALYRDASIYSPERVELSKGLMEAVSQASSFGETGK